MDRDSGSAKAVEGSLLSMILGVLIIGVFVAIGYNVVNSDPSDIALAVVNVEFEDSGETVLASTQLKIEVPSGLMDKKEEEEVEGFGNTIQTNTEDVATSASCGRLNCWMEGFGNSFQMNTEDVAASASSSEGENWMEGFEHSFQMNIEDIDAPALSGGQNWPTFSMSKNPFDGGVTFIIEVVDDICRIRAEVWGNFLHILHQQRNFIFYVVETICTYLVEISAVIDDLKEKIDCNLSSNPSQSCHGTFLKAKLEQINEFDMVVLGRAGVNSFSASDVKMNYSLMFRVSVSFLSTILSFFVAAIIIIYVEGPIQQKDAEDEDDLKVESESGEKTIEVAVKN